MRASKILAERFFEELIPVIVLVTEDGHVIKYFDENLNIFSVEETPKQQDSILMV